MNILDKIMGVKEASEIWGLSPDHIKRLCRDKKVIARNIGNTWIIIKEQPNPKGGRKMNEITIRKQRYTLPEGFTTRKTHPVGEEIYDEQGRSCTLFYSGYTANEKEDQPWLMTSDQRRIPLKTAE